jgi:predicted RND superfamily exporter protein
MFLLTALAAPGLLRLEVRTDGHALVPRDDPAVRLDAEIRRQFDLRDAIVVYVESSHQDGIYNPETLDRVQRLSVALTELEGVDTEHVMSLATERRDRVYTGTLRFRPFLDPLPETQAELDRLRSDVEATGILHGTLVSYDSSAAVILVGVPSRGKGGYRTALYRKVRETAEAVGNGGDRILVVGAPVAEALLGTHLLQDLALLIPLAVSMIALIVWWGCRRVWGVVLALTEVGACLVWTFGCMGWAGVPVYLTVAVLPVILTSIGLADEIHILWHYQRLLERGGRRRAVVATMDRMTRPVVLTSLTTSIGFLSFAFSPIVPVRVFGIFAALGVLFCMLWSLTVIPALLAIIDPERMRRPVAASASPRIARSMAGLTRHRAWTLAVVLLISVVALFGVSRVRVQDGWVDGFARGSEFRRAVEQVNGGLHGTHLLLARLSFADPGGGMPLLDPLRLEAIGAFERFARGLPGVGGVLGTHDHLTTMHHLLNARQPGSRRLPGDSLGMQYLMTYFDKVRGVERRRQIIDDGMQATVVTLFLGNANYRDTAELMRELRSYVTTNLSHFGTRLDFAGDVAVSQAMIPAVVETQINSLVAALVLAWLTVGLILRSIRTALLAILPSVVAALWVMGALGWLGVPLGVATSMFFVITLGIGIDYAVHFLDGVQRRRDRGADQAVSATIDEVGPAIVVDCLALALGFGLLSVSSVPANARLGLLVALALVACAVLTLGGLGALTRPGPEPEVRARAGGSN